MSKIEDFNARAYPSPDKDGDVSHMIVLTVLVKRLEGTWKAYAGIVPDRSRTDPQYRIYAAWVQQFGNPLRYEEARAIWHFLKDSEYAL